jgi:hypothetical protein
MKANPSDEIPGASTLGEEFPDAAGVFAQRFENDLMQIAPQRRQRLIVQILAADHRRSVQRKVGERVACWRQ